MFNSSVAAFIATTLLCLAGCAAQPHDSTPQPTREARLAAHIQILSADDMEGRGAGYEGERRAARYIAEQFAAAGLAPVNGSYFQAFEFRPVGGETAFQILPSRNVVGFLRGAARPDEIIVLGAHYDGQGMVGQAAEGRFGETQAGDDRIWNSASDNATSIAALIEIARSLNAHPPGRSVLFVAFSGEENRLNGAFSYVRNPALPWSRHVAMINLEKLVGHEETTLILATDGSGARFSEAAAAANRQTGLSVASFYPGIVSDTDHFAFNLAGLPALVIGTGAYEHVHHNTDVFETLHMAELPQRVDYVQAFLVALANDEAPLSFAADITPFSGVAGGAATPAELSACALSQPAFAVTMIARGVPAEAAGLRPGDVIVRVNGAPPAFPDEGANFLEDAFSARGAARIEIACGAARRTVDLAMPPAQAQGAPG
jgi:acetylornithine deacetylase/succinyl-diaminopimelate desuccinylase-like protein